MDEVMIQSLDDLFAHLCVSVGARLRNNEIRAESSCFPHWRTRLNPESLRLIARRDRAGRLSQYWRDNDGPASHVRMVLLLDRSEVGIHINKQATLPHVP